MEYLSVCFYPISLWGILPSLNFVMERDFVPRPPLSEAGYNAVMFILPFACLFIFLFNSYKMGRIRKEWIIRIIMLVSVLALVVIFILIGCNNATAPINEIPSVDDILQMSYSEVNEALSGKKIQEVRNTWGEPAESNNNEDIWQLDESMLLMILYNDTGTIASCELVCGTPFASTE